MEQIYEKIAELLQINPEITPIIFWCAVGVVAVLIIVIIACCVSGSKKKKTRKAEASKKVEVAQEPKKEVVEEKVEVKEEEKVEAKEEVKTEEPKEEVKKEEKPAPTKKSPAKKASTSKKEVVEEKPAPIKKNAGKFTISQEGADYRYRLKASNGELLVVSEPYTSEKAARTGIETIKRNVETAKIEIVEDKHGLFSFRVMTKQGRCLATSANYKTKARAVSASESFKKFAVTDKIEVEETSDHFEVEEFTSEITPEEKGKYKVSEVDDGFIYQLVASNGRVIATSQTYKSLQSCKDGLEKFRVLAYEGNFLIFKDKNDKYQFKLYNKQKRLVLAGEVYDTKDRVVSVIESIKRFAKLAEVVELVEKEVPAE